MLYKTKKYQFKTSLSEQEVYKILTDHTEEKRIRFSKSEYEFEGIVYKNSFKLEKTISGRNSFNPSIHGDFKSINHETIVTFNLKLNTFVVLFFTFWMSCVTLIAATSIVLIFNGTEDSTFGLVAIPMLAFGLLIYYIGTKIALNKIIETFEKLFNEKVIELT